jgi:hypothetical protein
MLNGSDGAALEGDPERAGRKKKPRRVLDRVGGG